MLSTGLHLTSESTRHLLEPHPRRPKGNHPLLGPNALMCSLS